MSCTLFAFMGLLVSMPFLWAFYLLFATYTNYKESATTYRENLHDAILYAD